MLPYLSEVQSASKKYSVMFRGLNYGEGTQDGEFAETHNLSTDSYPCITQRAARVKAGEYTRPSTLHAKGKLLVINDVDDETAEVYYDGKKIENAVLTPGKKQMATIGNYVVIFPDKKYYKVPTEDDQDGEFGDMEAPSILAGLEFSGSTIAVKKDFKFSRLKFEKTSITTTNIAYSGKVSQFVNDHIIFHPDYLDDDLSSIFKVNEEVTIEGSIISSNNITANIMSISGNSIYFDCTFTTNKTVTNVTITPTKAIETFPFNAGDTVIISGATESTNNQEVTIKSVSDDGMTMEIGGEATFTQSLCETGITITRKAGFEFQFKKGDAVAISGCENAGNNKDEEIIIRGVSENKDVLTFDDNSFTEATEMGKVTIKRTVPDLDFVCENNYRLWGTHGNSIYGSKYSDPLNFNSFESLAGDSYAIEVASEGEFTGCIAYSSHICFFKENTLHKLYGTKPSNFQITTANVYGVQSGCERSMQIVNEQLLYKGVGGVYAYTGGVPELISEKFGNNRYSDAVACCDGEKYYISMKQGDSYNLFTYDVIKNIWLREDDTQAVDMAFYDGKIYYIDSDGVLSYIDKTADRGGIEWGATFCTMHETMNERKGYSKFHLRMDLSAGAWFAVDIKTDNERQWKQIYLAHNDKAKTVSIPIIPTRCDSIDIRLRGRGKCTVKTFIREFTVGSDV